MPERDLPLPTKSSSSVEPSKNGVCAGVDDPGNRCSLLLLAGFEIIWQYITRRKIISLSETFSCSSSCHWFQTT
jgi:hypothetical protein